MPFYFFHWYEENTQHVEEHGVAMDEFEQVVCDPLAVERSRSSDRLVAFGYGTEGRKLACVYEMLDDDTVFPVTAYEID